MTPELSKKIIELIGKAEHFTVDKAPAVVQDVLLWAQIQWVFPAVMLFALILIGLLIIKHYNSKAENMYFEERYVEIALVSMVSFCALFAVICTIISVSDALQATFAPYSYLLDQLK